MFLIVPEEEAIPWPLRLRPLPSSPMRTWRRGDEGAPVLPSLRQEEHRGWDAQLRTVEYVLFLQFKRADYVSRRHPSSPRFHRQNDFDSTYVDGTVLDKSVLVPE
ncbi:hypothetical protein [Amycolatopsis pithecellobii]|uniref:Uncharacterized protein n=1 Tax=Amycolatopsis pithecellobii TaxID=664692 RepID=A0A6N7YM37_9PSEU|nr:hypothetical protein [Amycolatopsis pithecellobii]MTD53102.1 hypothetical protein [Amycolatopsis pithecellobii]